MRRFVPFTLTLIGCCWLAGCQFASGDLGDNPNTTTLRLEDADGTGFESCDSAGNCTSLPNPDGCAVLIIVIDNISGQTCERCEGADGRVLSDSCSDTHVVCTLVTAPEPDCVVCSYDQGAIIYSSCVADPGSDDCHVDADCDFGEACVNGACVPTGACRWDSDCPRGQHCEGSSVCPPDAVCVWQGEPGWCAPDHADLCSDTECGPAPGCPTYECPDGSWAGCGPCERDPATGVCGWTFRECPPDPAECTDAECGPAPMCPAFLCPDGSWGGCGGPCERDPATGTCGWTIRQCPPDPACHSDADCAPGEICQPECDALGCTEPGICIPQPQQCAPEDCGRAMCPSYQCADGTWTSACECILDAAANACQWQPIDTCGPVCDFATSTGGTTDPACEGRCRWDSDCAAGTHCEGSSVCPPGAVCFWAGEPGWCVPDAPAPCGYDECGPPPPCGAPLACEDGSIVGCSCERDAASGTCGWTYGQCPPAEVVCGNAICAPGLICCNPLESLCVPEGSEIACLQ